MTRIWRIYTDKIKTGFKPFYKYWFKPYFVFNPRESAQSASSAFYASFCFFPFPSFRFHGFLDWFFPAKAFSITASFFPIPFPTQICGFEGVSPCSSSHCRIVSLAFPKASVKEKL